MDRRDWAVERIPPTFHGDVAMYVVADKDGVYMALCGTDRAHAESVAANHNESVRRAA